VKRIQLAREHEREGKEGDQMISAAEIMNRKVVSYAQEVSLTEFPSSFFLRVEVLQLQLLLALAALQMFQKLTDAEPENWSMMIRSRHSLHST
jgi:hypothetical protein